MAVITGTTSSGRRALALLLLVGAAGVATATATAARETQQEGQQGTLQNEAAAALMAAAAAGQAAAKAAEENPPFHMMPAAADWDVEGGMDEEDPLANWRALFDGMDDADKADILGLDAENGLIRAALSGALNKNFFESGMASLLRSVRPQEAEEVFALFPPVQKMPAWQAFLAGGNGGNGDDKGADEAEEAAAKVSAVQELGKAVAALGALGSTPESVMDAVRAFTESSSEEAADPELQALMAKLEEGGEDGGATIERIQEKFLQRTLGAGSTLTMADFADTTWVEAARAALLGNEDLVRLIGDDKVLGLLSNPDLVPRRPSQFPDPESLLASW